MIDIATRRLYIRNVLGDDWPKLQEVFINRAASEYAAYEKPMPMDDESVKLFCEWYAHGDNFLTVTDTASGRMIGFISVETDTSGKGGELTYCVHSEFQRKGYAHEMCDAVISYFFYRMKLDVINASTAVDNVPSMRLLMRLGFEKSGDDISYYVKDASGRPMEFVSSTFVKMKMTQ